jgi:hypothetical protein
MRIQVILLFSATAIVSACAQTDEIQVYDAEIAEPGKFNLMLHNNFVARGRKTPEFPDGLVPDHSFNSVPEFAYGVTDWFEAGLYFPVYSVSKNHGLTFDSAKVRALFVSPHAAERVFFYGANFEFSYNTKYWDTARFSSELRPIIGWHVHSLDFIFNPILDTAYDGFKHIEFAPATRIAYNFSSKWAVAVEEYADLGSLGGFHSTSDQMHQIFAVLDHNTKIVNIEFGVGFGLTSASDKLTFKLMLSRDLN